MTKDRLETCSDSIFAIVLTLLVLDLRVPLAHGPAGLEQIAPSLLVHAATFLLVGVFWMLHHGALARVVEVNTRTLTLNLLTLFWITLLPYGAKNAAERPLEPLGASLISACCGFHQCQYDNQFYPSAPTYVPLPGFLEIDNGSAGCH